MPTYVKYGPQNPPALKETDDLGPSSSGIQMKRHQSDCGFAKTHGTSNTSAIYEGLSSPDFRNVQARNTQVDKHGQYSYCSTNAEHQQPPPLLHASSLCLFLTFSHLLLQICILHFGYREVLGRV